MNRSSKQKMIRRIGLSSVAAATALGLGFTVANASTTHSTGTQSIAAKAMAGRADAPKDCFGQFNALEVHGSISALTATSVTLTDPSGTVTTYTLASGFTVTKDHVAATVADLAVGQRVEAQLTAAGSTTINSIDIDVAPAFGHDGPNGDHPDAGPVAGGQVTAINGSTITVTDPHGNTDTITVDGTTTYTFNNAAGNLGEVTVGSYVFAQGTATGAGALTATSVAISTSATTFAHPGDGIGNGDGPEQGQFADR